MNVLQLILYKFIGTVYTFINLSSQNMVFIATEGGGFKIT